MGQEFAQREEWSEAKALDWWLLDAGMHEGVRRLVGDLNAAYRELPALHARDCEPEGFEWLIGNDHANSVFAWMRKAPGATAGRGHRQLDAGAARQLSRADADGRAAGASGSTPMPAGMAARNTGNQGKVVAHADRAGGWMPAYAELYLPPLATLILKYDPDLIRASGGGDNG